MDLVVTSLEAWDGVWRRNQHLVAGLLRRDPVLRVLFVEPATDPLHAALGEGEPRRGRGLRRGPVVDGVAERRSGSSSPRSGCPGGSTGTSTSGGPVRCSRPSRSRRHDRPAAVGQRPDAVRCSSRRRSWPSLYDVTDDWTLADRSAAETERVRAQEQVLLGRCEEVVVCSPGTRREQGRPPPRDARAQRRRHGGLPRGAGPAGRPARRAGGASTSAPSTTTGSTSTSASATAQALAGTGHLVLRRARRPLGRATRAPRRGRRRAARAPVPATRCPPTSSTPTCSSCRTS